MNLSSKSKFRIYLLIIGLNSFLSLFLILKIFNISLSIGHQNIQNFNNEILKISLSIDSLNEELEQIEEAKQNSSNSLLEIKFLQLLNDSKFKNLELLKLDNAINNSSHKTENQELIVLLRGDFHEILKILFEMENQIKHSKIDYLNIYKSINRNVIANIRLKSKV